jgi:hypothetical protein
MTRNQLHQLVDELTDDQIDVPAELLEAYLRDDRAMVSLLTAPSSPPEPDELAALAELTPKELHDARPIEELHSSAQ